MIWQLALLAAALSAVYYSWSRRRLYRLAAELPGIPDTWYPFIGHAHIFSGSNEDIMKTLQEKARMSNKTDGLLSCWLGNRLFVNMTDPAAIAMVSKACLDKDEFTAKFMRTAIGNGSVFAPVNIWHARRKINAPFFAKKNLNLVVPVFDKKSSIMANLLQAEAGKGDFSIWKYVTTFTFDTVCETALNVEINTQEKTEHTFFLTAIDECTQMVTKRALQPWLHFDFVYQNLWQYKQYQEHLRRGYSFIDKVIEEKRKVITSDGLKDYKTDTEMSHFIDLIIQSSGGMEKGYSDMELREELLGFMIAGSDTSATAISFTSILLSRYPDVQEKVHQELQDVFGDSDRAVTAVDLSRLSYLEAVIKEGLRLYPPVPVVVREVHKDVTLPSGTTLVDGTTVAFNIWGTHRNPDYWGPDPDEFRPERFLQDAVRHPAQFVPFSYSVRNCIGASYAMLSVKTALTNILRRYRLLPTAAAAADLRRPLRVKYGIMMKAVDNFQVRVENK